MASLPRTFATGPKKRDFDYETAVALAKGADIDDLIQQIRDDASLGGPEAGFYLSELYKKKYEASKPKRTYY
ncbi:MAG: hypothetical protein Q8S00_18640 [Deltaproteobacteria bacterium]|nr:hypothetical protein [Deltaproteobacteria bacterium]MDZ4346905.1 hypothetical protein [Candidatus Binatia bacterium]